MDRDNNSGTTADMTSTPLLYTVRPIATVFLAAFLAVSLPSCETLETAPESSGAAVPSETTAAPDTVVPEIPPARAPVLGQKHMVSAAHPLAATVGRDILRKGGNAIDAAIAIQMMLNLVEPQSSGIGGGGFLVYYHAKTGDIVTYDGRETAPASAHPYMFLDGTGKPRSYRAATVGGLPVGVPGLVHMLEQAHKKYGRLPWRSLFQPAIERARKGFPVSNAHACETGFPVKDIFRGNRLFFHQGR